MLGFGVIGTNKLKKLKVRGEFRPVTEALQPRYKTVAIGLKLADCFAEESKRKDKNINRTCTKGPAACREDMRVR